jgi:hypothetical protein
LNVGRKVLYRLRFLDLPQSYCENYGIINTILASAIKPVQSAETSEISGFYGGDDKDGKLLGSWAI